MWVSHKSKTQRSMSESPDDLPDWLEIEESKIPGAGLGVFAREAKYSKSSEEELGEYTGEKLTLAAVARRRDKSYLVQEARNGRTFSVDAIDPDKSGWPRYINSSDGPRSEGATKSLRPNVRFKKKLDSEGFIRAIMISTIKGVPSQGGDELLLRYGKV